MANPGTTKSIMEMDNFKILEKNQIDRVSTTRENLFDFMSRAEKESLAIF